MKKLYLIILFSVFLQAGVFDFLYINEAEKSYKNRDYDSAIKFFTKVENIEDITYNLANSYYGAKDYEKALEEYKKVKNPNIKFQKLHNMGNAYAKLGEIDDAIESYKKALKIKEDIDTSYNLALLVKHNKKAKKKKNDTKNGKGRVSDDDEIIKIDEDPHLDDMEGKSEMNNKKASDGKGKRRNQNQSTNTNADRKNKNYNDMIMSDMEERKYSKILSIRGIKTLMIPLSSEGDKKNEKNSW